jgi:hypothetical protein
MNPRFDRVKSKFERTNPRFDSQERERGEQMYVVGRKLWRLDAKTALQSVWKGFCKLLIQTG